MQSKYLSNYSATDPNTDECISTGDTDVVNKPENVKLKELLELIQMDSIKLPPGKSN